MSYEGLYPTFAQAILQIANGQAIAPPGDGCYFPLLRYFIKVKK